MILLLIATFVVLVHLLHYVKYRECYQLNLPGPFALPFIGNAHRFIGGSNEAILNVMTYLTTNWPTPLRFWLGPKYFVLVTKPEDVQVVLTSQHCLNRDDVYDFTRTYAGDGLIALKSRRPFQALPLSRVFTFNYHVVDKWARDNNVVLPLLHVCVLCCFVADPAWKEHRRFLNPCFSLRILQSFMPIFNQEVKTMCERLKVQAQKGGTFDMYEYMDACTLDMVCRKLNCTQQCVNKVTLEKVWRVNFF